MRYLLLIRHAAPQIVPDVPAARWRLSDEGRQQADLLGKRLKRYVPETIISSIEPKAMETAEIVAAQLHILAATAPGLHEHDRTHAPFVPASDWHSTMKTFFAQPSELVWGCETAEQARDRFCCAMADVVIQHPAGNVAIVAHGTVITLFVAQHNPVDPFTFWRQLGLAGCVVLALPSYQLVETVPST